MCTLSWITSATGYDVLCNRDERLDRPAAEPPCHWPATDGGFIAPRDPEGGGTWISVNTDGLTLCLVNHYAAEHGANPDRNDRPWRSRGGIVTGAASCRDMVGVRTVLDEAALSRYRPFVLIAFLPGEIPVAWRWDGKALVEEPMPRPPLTTSSFRHQRVAALRRRHYRPLQGERPGESPPDLERLFAYHRSVRTVRSYAGVAMRRRDAATVSLTHVSVGPEGIEMRYFAGNPAEGIDATPAIARLPAPGPRRLPGDCPPARVERETLDIPGLFREKNPDLYRRLPRIVFTLLDAVAHRRRINRGLYDMRQVSCRQFPARVLEHLGVDCRIDGVPAPRLEQRPIFAANHPLGALDGLAMLAWMLGRYRDVRVPVNDILARLPHLRPFIAALDKYRRQREATRVLHSTFASDAAILVFPAGGTSRRVDGRLRDGRWAKMPVRMALAYGRPIVPVHIDARNSWRFYALAGLRRLLGIRLNLEMMLLADEMLRPSCRNIGITLGQPVYPEELERMADNDHDRAALLRAASYAMEPVHPSRQPLRVAS